MPVLDEMALHLFPSLTWASNSGSNSASFWDPILVIAVVDSDGSPRLFERA